MSTFPTVSVIMPVRNESHFISRSLDAVLAQDYPVDRMEVLVADGMSTDDTRDILGRIQREDGRVKIIDNPGGIVATGLNLALREARGRVIVRVDGHCEIAPDYVRRSVAHLETSGAEGVGGPLQTVGETRWARIIAAAMSSPFGVGDSSFRVAEKRAESVDTIAFPAYTRAVIDRAGQFDEELVRNQDDEYNYRLRKLGVRLLLADDVRARYYSRSSLRSLGRQYFQYGYWKVRVMQKHPRQMRPRQFVPALLVVALSLAALLSPLSTAAAAAGLGLAALYAAANLAASWRVGRKLSERPLFALSAAFTALHFSYGAGFLFGLLRFRRRWSPTL